MLGTRLVIGLSMVAGILLVLGLDERWAPWFPIWFVLSLIAIGASAMELVGLLAETSARPSGNTVFGGVMALVVANWAPHVTQAMLTVPRLADALPYDASAPVGALAWPFFTFVAIVMGAFVIQSAQFDQPGRTMATIAGTVLSVA